MLGVWQLNTTEARESVAYLIQHLPCDGRLEVVIREAVNHTEDENDDERRPVHDPQA